MSKKPKEPQAISHKLGESNPLGGSNNDESEAITSKVEITPEDIKEFKKRQQTKALMSEVLPSSSEGNALNSPTSITNLFLENLPERMKEQQFSKELVDAMFSFQLLESTLRAYIQTVFDLVIAKLEDDDITFNHNAEGIHGLGELIRHFKKYCDKEEVCKVLTRKLREERNFIAHELVFEFTDNKDDNEKHIERLKQAKKLAQDATGIVMPELKRMGKIYEKVITKLIKEKKLLIEEMNQK